jgi:N-acetylneuraminic acid mutarotase
MKSNVFSLLIISLLLASAAEAADDWTQKFPTSKPSARLFHAMAYAGDDQVLLFGGYANVADNDETWIYDLSENTWTQKFPNPHPSARRQHSLAYIGGDQVLLFGGDDGRDETWVYDLSDNTWTQQSPASKPSERDAHAMAYIGGDQVLLFGGLAVGGFSDETWLYDLSDNTWTDMSSSSRPIARRTHAMAYIGGDQVLMFGGDEGSYVFRNDTWIYDLSAHTWTEQNPALKPAIRWGSETAYLGGDKVVLFGGANGGFQNDTWIFDLSDGEWTQDANTTQPSPRREFGLAETSMDGSSYPVLFGGEGDSGDDDETWTFGGGDYPVAVEIAYSTALPETYALHQNFPNPFNLATEISYAVPRDVHVTVKIYNIQGAEAVTLVDGNRPAGFYAVSWNAEGLASGIYFCRMKAGECEKTIKMALVR